MLNIEEFISELSVSIDEILWNDWNPKKLKRNAANSGYKDIIPLITAMVLENFTISDLAEKIYSFETKTLGEAGDKTRSSRIAKLFINERELIQIRLIGKGKKERREKMNMALKSITIPFLRAKGFKGTYP